MDIFWYKTPLLLTSTKVVGNLHILFLDCQDYVICCWRLWIFIPRSKSLCKQHFGDVLFEFLIVNIYFFIL